MMWKYSSGAVMLSHRAVNSASSPLSVSELSMFS